MGLSLQLRLGYEDLPLQPRHVRITKNSIPKTLWRKEHAHHLILSIQGSTGDAFVFDWSSVTTFEESS